MDKIRRRILKRWWQQLEPYEKRGLYINWVFDAVRQFGADAAMEVVEWAHRCKSPRIVAFGIGGDELSIPTKEFQGVYHRAGEYGMHRLIHAGEIGGPEKIREAVELLGAERIGHGIAAIHDRELMDMLKERRITLEICPVSNIKTGALERQMGEGTGLVRHPFPKLFRHGIPVVLSTDDPAMFHTSLTEEYQQVQAMGLNEEELAARGEARIRERISFRRKKRNVFPNHRREDGAGELIYFEI